MNPLILITIFVVATLIGYKLIKNVPSLLHTPLMSGMIALTGVAVLGALGATIAAVHTGNKVLGVLAIILASVNIAAGYYVTGRMLGMFHRPDAAKTCPAAEGKGVLK